VAGLLATARDASSQRNGDVEWRRLTLAVTDGD
jgi:hypothetical protein